MEVASTSTPQNESPVPISAQLNLNLDILHDPRVLENKIYKRLHNILASDINRSEHTFRVNLIRELYFLLQVTPVIANELQESFLTAVEQWYDMNDHKKIDLAANKLSNLYSIVCQKKEKDLAERPKSGNHWNSTVSPFLRPYTAQRRSECNTRPNSSKANQQSTQAAAEEFCIRDFTTTIEEEKQISLDFMSKRRTVYPNQEPVYEQLHQILKRIEKAEPELIPKKFKKITRFSRSAVPKSKLGSNPEPLHYSLLKENQQQVPVEQPKEKQQEEKIGQISEGSSNSSDDEECLFENPQYRVYSKNNSKGEEISQLSEKQIARQIHIKNHKRVQANREDLTFAQSTTQLARIKSATRRELSRISESKRMMNAQSANRLVKNPLSVTAGSNSAQPKPKSNVKVYDMATNAEQPDQIVAFPTYNQRTVLKRLYEKDRLINEKNCRKSEFNELPLQTLTGSLKPERPMTAFQRFNSPIRFDPMSQENIKKHNQEALNEIDRIKAKMGGKNYASTDSLMKALLVHDPAVCEEQPEKFNWENRSPFYNMISNGVKPKKLKKGRKHRKSSAKSKK